MWGLLVRPSFSLLQGHAFVKAGCLKVESILGEAPLDRWHSCSVVHRGVGGPVGSSFSSLAASVSSVQSSSVAQSCLTLRHRGLQHARLPCPSPTPGVYSNPCPLSQRCHPTISSFAAPLSSFPQSFSASGSYPMNQLFTSGGQSIGASALDL